MTKNVISFEKFRAMASELLSRSVLASRLGQQFGGKRELYTVFGYNIDPDFNDFISKYARQDIAKRVVDAPACSTWTAGVDIDGGNTFNTGWKKLVKTHNLWNMFLRADKLAGLGRYSIIFIGFDGNSSDHENNVKGARNVLFLQPFSESNTEIKAFNEDPKSPRFGMPEIYEIEIVDPKVTQGQSQTTRRSGSGRKIKVHWSRILHVAENTLQDNVLGIPRMSVVYNRLDDLEKVVGGSAEAYWLMANRGLHLDVDPEMELTAEDEKALAAEAEEYQHELRRLLRTRGVKVQTLGSDVADPTGVVNTLVGMISSATGIPRRILMGSEAGQLASEQDRANWAERIAERRIDFAEPKMIFPFISLLVNARVLPEPVDLQINWPSAFNLSPLENAQQMAQFARASINLSKQTLTGTQITTVNESRKILGLEPIADPRFDELIFAPRVSAQPLDSSTVTSTNEQ